VNHPRPAVPLLRQVPAPVRWLFGAASYAASDPSGGTSPSVERGRLVLY